jgi:hypothetical protein
METGEMEPVTLQTIDPDTGQLDGKNVTFDFNAKAPKNDVITVSFSIQECEVKFALSNNQAQNLSLILGQFIGGNPQH